MTVEISVGTTIAVVSGEPATYDLSGFSALTYTTIGEVTSIPDFGGAAEVPTHTPLSSGVVNKRQGSIDYGDVSIPIARDYTDAGQAAIKSGFDGANKGNVHSFKIYNADIGTIYFTAIISSDIVSPNDANSFFGGSFTANLTNALVTTGGTTYFTLAYGLGTNPTNGKIIGPASQTVASGADGSAVYAAPNATKTFVDWSDASTQNPRTDLAVSANISVTANFSV